VLCEQGTDGERANVHGCVGWILAGKVDPTFGVNVARRLLMRFGYADGYEDAVSLRGGPERMDTMELFKSGPMVHTLEGVVQATLKIIEFDPERGHVEATVEWQHSYEGEQHVHLCGKSDTPVCWTLVGYASGYARTTTTAVCGRRWITWWIAARWA